MATRVEWRRYGNVLRLALRNFALQLATLGFFYFWGKVEARQSIWASVRIDGQPLEYSGTGRELLTGFLISNFIFFVPAFFLLDTMHIYVLSMFGDGYRVQVGFWLFYTTVVVYFSGVALYRARRYRLSRTCWRGLSGGMSGRGWSYGWLYLWTMAVQVLSLFLLMPWRDLVLRRRLAEDSWFGDRHFAFDSAAGGGIRKLVPVFSVTWLLLFLPPYLLLFAWWAGWLPSLPEATPDDSGEPSTRLEWLTGVFAILFLILAFSILTAIVSLIFVHYQSRLDNLAAAATRYRDVGFELKTTPWSLFRLNMGNFLIVLLSLGALTPLALERRTRYMVERLAATGSIDFAAVGQNEAAGLRRGEGLAEVFDVNEF